MPDRPPPDYWGHPPFGDGDLDAWLAGSPAAAPQAVDDVLSALRAGPSHAELAGENRALAEFGRVNRRAGPRHQLPVMWLATAAALIAVAICGAAAATGRLPTPIQNLAHVVFAAPSGTHLADSSQTGSSSPSANHSPWSKVPKGAALSGSGSAQVSWGSACAAYKRESADGGKPWMESAYRALVNAAGSPSRVLSFCAAHSGSPPGSKSGSGSKPDSGSKGSSGSDNPSGSGSGSAGSGSSGSGSAGSGSGSSGSGSSGSGSGPGSGSGSSQGNSRPGLVHGPGSGNGSGNGNPGSGSGAGNGSGGNRNGGSGSNGSGSNGHADSGNSVTSQTARTTANVSPNDSRSTSTKSRSAAAPPAILLSATSRAYVNRENGPSTRL